MRENSSSISDTDRAALLREGIVVLEATMVGGRLEVCVTGAGSERVVDVVAARLGPRTDVEVCGDTPRRNAPRRCLGHMEREARRLQVRFELRGDEHVDEIHVAEDAETVVVLGTVCTSVIGEVGERCEVPCHVYLERPLGDRVVIDGASGKVVPYKNVYATLGRHRP